MNKHSHAAESFSHFIVALVVIVLGVAVIGWAFSRLDAHNCPAGLVCYSGDAPTQVHY